MVRRAPAILALIVAACGASGPRGWYPTSPGSGYGFEFADGGTVLSRAGGDIARGTYTVNGSGVLVCIGPLCTELTMDGDCLVQDSGSRYCKEP